MTDATVGPSQDSYRGPNFIDRLIYGARDLRRRWFPRDGDSNIVMFAKHELSLIRDPSGKPDEMQDEMERHILAMCRTFSREGHSGFSAGYAVNVLQKVLRFEPLTPLTGADDEWNDIAEMNGSPMWQNRRCGHVFKDETGAYDINGRVFQEPSGACFTGSGSRVPVAFPYTPTKVYVLVDDEGERLPEPPS